MFNQYPQYIISKFLNINKRQIFHIFIGLSKKNKYYAYLLNVPKNYQCQRYHFCQKLNDILYIEYLQGECSNLSVFKFITINNQLIRFYLRRYNFSILPSIKYILKKLEQDPDFLKPLITTTLTAFYNFYQQFYNTIMDLRQQLNIPNF